jgi:hypothetical protein
MTAILLGMTVCAIAAVLLALALPIRIHLQAGGGTDRKVRASACILFYCGLFGARGTYGAGRLELSLLLGRSALFSLDAARLTRGVRRVKRGKGAHGEGVKTERRELGAVSRPLADRVRAWIRTARKYEYFTDLAVREICALVRIDRFEARVKLGLVDPSLTGAMIGILSAINGVLPERYVIRPEWDFTRPVASCDGDIELTFRSHVFWAHLARELRAYMARRKTWQVSPHGGITAQEV